MGMGMGSMIMTMRETRGQVETHSPYGFCQGQRMGLTLSRGSATAYTVGLIINYYNNRQLLLLLFLN